MICADLDVWLDRSYKVL